MSEVAHRSFCVKFSGLIIELIILENYIEVLEYSKHKFIFGLFLKLRKSTFQEKKKKIYGAPMKPSELFCFKYKIHFAAILFFS